MKSSNIGGQAVMEGIMMRHKDKYSIAVRRPDKEIELKVEDYKCVFGNAKFLRYPLIRGVVSFVDSLVVGTKCLMYSAEIAGDEEDEEDAQKNAALSEEERAAKKAKEDKAIQMALICNGSNFHYCVYCSVYASSLCACQPLQESRSFRVCGNDRGSICEAGIVYGIYAADLQDEGYSAYIHVPRCRT